ncbi:unnamed protein product [Spirodela intermedia]|uniref:Uncharacterized protein n=1 Tax=Spirodela intermedia TaxID=51605 RepID=A0A7I8I8Z7_SPIIN|nr:unnamed protein product [Spirodela intermedia]CAA6654157.1 unnamed protein product [Spirodela intermedia]
MALPKRIILVRHGESMGNLDMAAYSTTPDYRIPLTPLGVQQARAAGMNIRDLLSSASVGDWKVYFYVSPYERTRSTLRELGRAFPRRRVVGVREECRIREQDFGNFQVEERMRAIKETRQRFGRFFFRFPEGESAADVFDRVANAVEGHPHEAAEPGEGREMNLVIVSHGLTSRVFLMKWFKWTVEEFERLNNPGNCDVRVMELGPCGTEYSLAVHHSTEELESWGLSPEMIADQRWRAAACRGPWSDDCPSYLDGFLDLLDDDDDEGGGDEDEGGAAREGCRPIESSSSG